MQVIDTRLKKKSLVDYCMDETGGVGIDCVIDNGGNSIRCFPSKCSTRNGGVLLMEYWPRRVTSEASLGLISNVKVPG